MEMQIGPCACMEVRVEFENTQGSKTWYMVFFRISPIVILERLR
jgi:hypothetical protein